MFLRKVIPLALLSILFLLVGWSITLQSLQAQGPTATPTPTAMSQPGFLPGVNYWSPEIRDFFPAPKSTDEKVGYVLFDNGRPNSEIEDANKAGFIPILRYDVGGGYAVPRLEPTPHPITIEKWVEEFTDYITRTYEVGATSYGSTSPTTLYIVGNEPRLEDGNGGGNGGIPFGDYAKAYAALWKTVHGPDANGSYLPYHDNVQLLVAGQAAHQEDTITWLSDVSQGIVQEGADIDGYAIHTYGYGNDIDGATLDEPEQDQPTLRRNCKNPTQLCNGVGLGTDTWKEDDSFQNYKHQLVAIASAGFGDKPVYITEFNTNAAGRGPAGNVSQQDPASPFVPANNYPTGWIIDAIKDVSATQVSTYRNLRGLLWFVGTPNGPDKTDKGVDTDNWRYFALTEDYYRLDCIRADLHSVSRQEETRWGCNPEASAPKFRAAPYFVQCQMKGIAMVGSDDESGLNQLTAVASPAKTYDFSQTESGQIVAGILDIVPQVGSYATLTLSDRAGNITQQKVYNPGKQQCNSSGAGGDHPDDNQSAASSLLPGGQFFTLPAGARTSLQVAILNRGFAANLWQALLQIGEPAVLINADFDPTATARQYPILFIPSGGLYGLENSVVFRQRLEFYAEAGGTIVAFAQQHGYEFNVLPGAQASTPQSPSLSAYGWQEDNSCYEASLLLAADHPSLSGFSQTALTAHVDGYFSTVPTNTTTLLTRNQNGAPGTILYPHGQGRVIATSMYDDWGAANGQLSDDAQTFLRDLISWAVDPVDIPTYAPGATVSLSAVVTNDTENEAVAVRFTLVNPAREIVETQVVTTTLAPGASTTLNFAVSSPASSPLGIWRLDAALLNGRGLPIGPRTPVNRFVIANPPQTTASNRPFDLKITAQSDRFPKGSRGEFTFHVANHSGETRTVTVRYGLPHHTWEVGTDPNTGSGYGLFYGHSQDLTIPAQSEITFVYSPTLYTTDRLWARVDEGNQTLAYAHFAIFPLPADLIRVTELRTNANDYARGSLIQVMATLTNNYGYRFENPVARLTVIDAEETELYQADVPLATLQPGAAAQLQTTFTLSPTAHSGVAKLNLEVGQRDNGFFYRYGGARATFRVSSSPLGSYFPADLILTPGLSQTVPLAVTNLNPFLDVNVGQVSVQLLDGSTAVAASISQTFSLAASQSLSLPLSLDLPDLNFSGDYRLAVSLEDEYDHQVWQTTRLPLTLSAIATFDRPAYQVRGTAAITVTLHNPGPFVQVLTLTLAAPDLAFEETRSVTLAADQDLDQTYVVAIPTDAPPGLHALNLSAMLPNTSQLNLDKVGTMYIPDSKLQAVVSGQPTDPGDVLTVNVANVGGVDTTTSYNLSIYDSRSYAVATVTGVNEAVLVDQPLAIPITIPDQFRSGPYNLAGFVTDQSTGQRVSVYQVLNLGGLTNQLATFTDADVYLTTDPIETTAVITNTGVALTDGQLSMRIVSAGPVETASWRIYTTADGLAEDTVNDVVVDAQGNKWFLHPQQLSRLSPGGDWDTFLYIEGSTIYQTIAAAGDTIWIGTNTGAFAFDGVTQVLLEADPGNNALCVQGQTISDVAVDSAGRIWFATSGSGLCVLDPNSTPTDLSDDQWGQFTAGTSALPDDNPLRLAFDTAGHVWVMHHNSLNVLNYGTGPFNPTDDAWVRLASPLYYWWQAMTALTIDGANTTWLGTNEGLFRLNDGGTDPFVDTSDDSWTKYAAYNSQLIDNYIKALAPDRAGNLWIGTDFGLSVLLPGERWRSYTPFDGIGSGVINAIAVDAAGNRWLATSQDTNEYLGMSVNLLGGITAAIGPGLPESPWKTFTGGYNISDSDLLGNQIAALATDPAGNVWIAGRDEVGPQQSVPWKSQGLASPLRQGYYPFVQRLAPGNNWTTFDFPSSYDYNGISDMIVDVAGHLWLAVDDDYDNGGLYMLSPHQATWETRHPVELPGQPKALAVAGMMVWAAFDPILNEESVNPEGIAIYSLIDQSWAVLYQGSESLNPDDHLEFRDLAIDSSGGVWIATDKGVRQLSADGSTWSIYTTDNSDLVSNDVQAVAVDLQGHRWFATPDGVSILDADSSQWTTFSVVAATLAVDGQGEIWFGHSGIPGGQRLNYGLSPFDTADDVLTIYDGFSDLGNRYVNDIAVDEAGQVWVGTMGQGLARYAPPSSSAGRVIWQHSAGVNADTPETVQEVANLTAAELGVTGKFYLEADLATPLGQPLGSARYPFYIFPTQTGLTLAPDRMIYQPGQSITLTGQIHNGAAQPLTGQTLVVSVNGQVVYTEPNLTVPAEDDYPFSLNTTAPSNTGRVIVEAAIDDLTVRDSFVVATSALDTHLSAPDVVGRDPFDLRLTLTNLGRLDLNLSTILDGQAEALTLPAGETQIISRTKQIVADTLVAAQISGDVMASVTQTIQMGEASDVTLSPEPLYGVGRVEIPYLVTNTGQLALAFPLDLNLYSGATLVQADTLNMALPVAGAISGLLAFDLPAGDYRLEYSPPFATGVVNWQVAAFDQVALDVQTQTPVRATIPLTITLGNTGANSVSGHLTIETAFFSDRGDFALEPGQTFRPNFSINTSNAAPGIYPVTVTAVAANGMVLATQTATVTIPSPHLTLTAVPNQNNLTPGRVVTLTFVAENEGSAIGEALLAFTLADFEDESQLVSLEPGESNSVDFSFYLPPELAAGDYLATYVFSNTMTGEAQRGDFALNVAGMNLAVAAALDKAVYTPGEMATLTLDVTNQSARPTTDLYALARYGDAVVTQTFSLAGNGAQTLNLAVPVAAEGIDDTLFYGIYDQASTRGVYLNTTHLYRLNSVVTLYPNQAVYLPGATVQGTVATTRTGFLLVRAPGYSQTLTLNGSNTNFSFTLPGDLTRGTYTIDYILEGFLPRSAAFDVADPWVRVTEARLVNLPYTPGDQVQLDLTVASETSLEVDLRAWLLYPDGTQSTLVVNALSLQSRLNNHTSLNLPFSSDQAGPQRLVYQLTASGNPDQIYAAGVEEFTMDGIAVLSVHADQDDYLGSTDPVKIVATLVATQVTAVQVELEVDGVVVISQGVNLTPGSQTVTLPVSGVVTPGWHTARVRLNAGGLSSVAETQFVYGAFGSDLVVRSPRLFTPSGFTATLYTYVYNLGDQPSPPSTLRLYDGDPAANGQLIAEVAVPAMPAKKPFFNDTAEFFVTWNVARQAGLHTVYAVADAGQAVMEINEDNNVSQAELEVPDLSLMVSTDKETYQSGEPVNITVAVANLQASGNLNITLTTTADLLGYKPFQVVEPVTILAGDLLERQYTWPVTATYGGVYNLIAGVTGNMDPIREYAQFTLPVGAEFTAEPLTGTVPLSVTFNDLSSPWGWLETWQWDFGDGNTSTESNPVHLYEIPGNYTVTLTTTVGLSTYVKTKPNYITAYEAIAPIATFNAEPVIGLIPLPVTFTDTSTGTVITRTWDFGDGTPPVVTTSVAVSHTYSVAGVYTPSLTVDGSEGSAVITRSAYILAVTPQISGTFALEAEDYVRQITGTDLAWQTRTIHAGYSGGGYVQARPDTDVLFTTAPISTSSELQYGLGLTITGTYTVWLRGFAENSAGDSLHVGLDGQPFIPTDYVSKYPPGKWAWDQTLVESSQPITFTLDTPGAHTLHIWIREDGFSLDQIILTNDDHFAPGD
jgi:PKD repeat protein/ligand-binding sensor domain-containing protein